MIQLEFTVQNQDVKKALDELEYKIKAGAREAANRAAEVVHDEIISAMRRENTIASGDLMRSVTVGTMQASTEAFTLAVGSESRYASDIEFGMPAGRNITMSDIYQWMIFKQGLEPSFRAAYLIARKLRKAGYEGRHVFEKGLTAAEPKIQDIANKAMDDALRGEE